MSTLSAAATVIVHTSASRTAKIVFFTLSPLFIQNYRRGGTRQHISKVEPDRMLVCAFRGSGRNKPWISEKIRVLKHQLHRAVLAVGPQCLRESCRSFLSRPIVTIRRAGIPVADPRAIRIHGSIP